MLRQTNQQVPLDINTMSELSRVAANSSVPLAQLQTQAQAQGAMRAVAEQMGTIQVPKVNFYPSRHPDRTRARRRDIKQAYRLLKPMRRSRFSLRRWWFGGKYRYNHSTTTCVVDGCDVEDLIRTVGNVYEDIVDEEIGHSLWDMYFRDPMTGDEQAFLAREGVTSGRELRGTYCPEHLHLYHLVRKWEREEEAEQEATSGTLRAKLRRGVSVVAMPIPTLRRKNPLPPRLEKYEPVFQMFKEDKIPVWQVDADVTIVMFNRKQFNTTPMPLPAQGVGAPMAFNATPQQSAVLNDGGLAQMLEQAQAAGHTIPIEAEAEA
tara:strand:- start:4992 stop:5951 length:960 start_codon:yes stop_codon:yes gene_type:complete